MNTPNQLTKLYNDGFNDGYNKAKSNINPELEELKIKLADALQAQAFWRECYHNAAGFWHADLRGANLYGADLRGAIIPSGVKIP